MIKQITSWWFWKQHDRIIAKFKYGRRLASFKRHSKGALARYERIRRVKLANDNA